MENRSGLTGDTANVKVYRSAPLVGIFC